MKIHIGCGKRFFPGWKHADIANYSHIDFHNIIDLPCSDSSIDIIYSSHTLEYFDQHEVKNVLKEWHRVLKHGGVLRLAVPNFEAITKLYFSGMWPIENFIGPIYGRIIPEGQTNPIFHKMTYDFNSLKNLLENIGFKNIKYWNWREVDHGQWDDCSQAYLPKMDKENGTLISLNLECEK
jgi:predicted SAM-dependent methyltransferase